MTIALMLVGVAALAVMAFVVRDRTLQRSRHGFPRTRRVRR
ncbi:MAG: hypothetical protein ACLFS5_01935 [Spirochaetaceae bacterium]